MAKLLKSKVLIFEVNNTNMKITITGSLGNIGKPLARQLIQQGHDVTLVSSNPEKKADIETLGANAAIGSVLEEEFLVTAFAGADAVFAMIPPNYAVMDSRAYYREIGYAYQKAIKATNVKRVVHLSSWGAHLPQGTGFIVGSYDTENILDRLPGVLVTHIRPGSFYTNLYSFIGMIKQAGFIGANYGGDDEIVMVSPLDIADAIAHELNNQEYQKIRYVGSEDIKASEAACILGAEIGMPDLQWITFTDTQYRAALDQAGIPSYVAAMLVELGASIHNGAMREDYDLHKPLLGKVKIKDFAKEFATIFRKD